MLGTRCRVAKLVLFVRILIALNGVSCRVSALVWTVIDLVSFLTCRMACLDGRIFVFAMLYGLASVVATVVMVWVGLRLERSSAV